MRIALWVLQVLLAFAFLGAGLTKLTQPIEALLAGGMTFVQYMPEGLVRFIGLAEVAGALGLVLPAASRIQPQLTPIAAASLTLVMLLAVLTHVVLGEWGAIAPPLVLGALSASVAWGRWAKHPIAPRAALSASPGAAR